MIDWLKAFLIGGFIMVIEKVAAELIGPEYAALGLPTEFIAAFFMFTRKDKEEYFLGILLILAGFIITLSVMIYTLYRGHLTGNEIATLSLMLWFILSFMILKFYSHAT